MLRTPPKLGPIHSPSVSVDYSRSGYELFPSSDQQYTVVDPKMSFFPFLDGNQPTNFYTEPLIGHFAPSQSSDEVQPLDTSSDDFDTEKSASGVLAFVNQLLDESDIDNFALDKSADARSSENSSIGELAIKLADLVLLDDSLHESQVLDGQLSMHVRKDQDYSEDQSQSVTDEVEQSAPWKQIYSEFSAVRNHNKRDSVLNNSELYLAPESEDLLRRPASIGPNLKKKKNNKWTGPRSKPVSTVSKIPMKDIPTFLTDIQHGQIKRKFEMPLFTHGINSTRVVKPFFPFQDCPVPPFLLQMKTNGSLSDGSSSSGSYGINESKGGPPHDMMTYQLFPKRNEDKNHNTTPPPRHTRKSFSSSSSNGGRPKYNECVFCKTNGETAAMYRSHVLKDDRGRTVCKVLQKYVCPLCGATGSYAHTLKYCPKNENPPPVATMTTLKSMRSSTGRKRHGHCSAKIRHVPLRYPHNPLPA